jgi:hypothetical protein
LEYLYTYAKGFYNKLQKSLEGYKDLVKNGGSSKGNPDDNLLKQFKKELSKSVIKIWPDVKKKTKVTKSTIKSAVFDDFKNQVKKLNDAQKESIIEQFNNSRSIEIQATCVNEATPVYAQSECSLKIQYKVGSLNRSFWLGTYTY